MANKVIHLDCMYLKSIGHPVSEELMLWSELPPKTLHCIHQASMKSLCKVFILCLVGYQSLIGSSMHSWGWDLGRCKAYHNSDQDPGRSYPLHEQSYPAPDRFLMVLDMDLGTLSFVAKGKYLGVAHTGLRGKAVFPTVSSVWGHCEVRFPFSFLIFSHHLYIR